MFCKNQGFTAIKTQTFVGIMKTLLDEDSAAAHRDIRQSFQRLKQLLLEHSVERPPHAPPYGHGIHFHSFS